jgi:hypothetical protein
MRLRSSSAVLAIAATATGGVALLAIAWLATRRLTSVELGFFFAFLSLGAFVQLADFGLSYAALQTGGRLAGTNRLHELPAIARHVTRWITFSAGLATITAGAIGFAIFSSRNADVAGVAWRAPWLGYLVSVFALQVVTPGVFLREGSGKILQMWRLRLVQELIGATACLLALHAGAGLWSLCAYAGTRAFVAALWLFLGDPLRSDDPTITYSIRQWMTDVWPFQWKIGLSGLSGFLIFRSFAPIVLLEQGAVAAGSFGLAISFMNLLIAVSTSWPMSQAARYSMLAASRRYEELHRDFPRMLVASTLAAAAATTFGVVVMAEARRRGIVFAQRLPEQLTTTVIFATAIVHHIVICFAVALRAEGREPLLIPSVVGGLVNIAAIWLAAHYGTLRDIAIVNLALALIGIPIAGLLLRARKRHLLGG